MASGATILLNTLKAHHVKTIFGIVGREAEAILFNEVPGIEFILTRDERTAAFMADMQGRLTGKVGVCYSTFGPGATNLVTGVASAYADRSPVLAISAQVESNAIHPCEHQCLDQARLMRPITKYAKEITDINTLQYEAEKAIALAQEGIPGPCFLSIPWDLFGTESKRQLRGKAFSGASVDDRRNLSSRQEPFDANKFLELFRRSRSPIFIVGDGVYREKMHRSFRQLIDRLGIPAVSTYAGKNAFFDEDDYYLLAVSKYWDVFAPGLLREVFKKNDLIALIGFDMAEGLRQSVWDFGISKKICAINSICENKKESLRMDLRVKAPYPEVFKALLGLGRKFMTRKEARAKKKQFSGLRRDLMKAGADFTAFDVVATLDKELSGDDILISDVGLHKQYAALFYRLKMPGTFFCSNGLASMGFGLPAAISAKKTYPRRRVVALCGDAGFHSVSHELETSIRCRLPVVCLVINDSGVGLIKHYQRKGFKVSDDNTTSFGRVDFVSLAQANGCDGFCVSSKKQLQKKLKKALESDKTVLVEVLLDKKKYSG